MFFEQEEFEKKFLCLNCKQRINKSKLLPCGETICESCLNGLVSGSTSIKCPFCFKDHECNSDDDLFPTQKLLNEMLELKPVKIYRGNEKLLKLLAENELFIKNFHYECNNMMSKIQSHCNFIRNEIENDEHFEVLQHDDDLTSIDNDVPCESSKASSSYKLKYQAKNIEKLLIEKESLLNQVELYEQKCYLNLNTKSSQQDYIKNLFDDSLLRIKKWRDIINKSDFSLKEETYIHDSALAMKHMLINSRKFYESLIFLGQLLMYKSEYTNSESPKSKFYQKFLKRQLKFDEFSYMDILNTDRLNSNYKTSNITYRDLLLNPKCQILQTMWLSLVRIDRIIICLYIFNEITSNFEVVIKSMDNNGQLLNENFDNKNCELITMATCEKYIIIAIKNFNILNSNLYKLYDLDLKLIKSVSIDYTTVTLHRSDCYIYALCDKTPFVHVHNWSLEEKYSFGQDVNSNEAFYMPNVIQIYVRNEKLYIRDSENIYIKVLTLNNGNLIKLININLLDCLLHIDSIGRIIVINQDSKILFIFNEDAQILFEYDLTFIHSISSFCITNNGHLLINDADNKILHII